MSHTIIKRSNSVAKNKVEIVGVNTSKLKNLNKDQILILLKKYHEGDQSAFNELINGNLKLVLSIVQKYNNRKENLDDIFQIGVLGLIKAINNFDLSKNVLFSTYAVPMISGEIKRYLRDNNMVKVSRQIKDIAYKALKVKEDYLKEHNKEPSIKEIANMLNVDEYDVKEAFDSSYSVVSIYEPVHNENGDDLYLIDQISNDNFENNHLVDFVTLEDALNKLDSSYKKIIHKRYFEDLTQMEIAKEFNVSQAQISRIEKQALNELRKYF